MPKRFTSTEIWEEDWFLNMPNDYKLFWQYMLSACDHAGLFKVNLRSFCGLLGVSVTSAIALELFNIGKQRIRVITDSLWLIEDFFVFQYGTTFNPNNKLHESVEKLYLKQKIEMTSIRGLLDLKDRVKDKDKDKDRKGGMGGNQNGKPQRGEKFDPKKEFVIFPDGSKQKLGDDQLHALHRNTLRPDEVYQGNVY